MKILSAEEMSAADRRSVAAGIPMQDLMEAAGAAVATLCRSLYPNAERVMVCCGTGNNGGDGFVAARILASEGIGVRVLLLGHSASIKAEAAEALSRLTDATAPEIVEELEPGATVADVLALLDEADLIIDAVVGTGFKPPLRGPALTLRDAIKQIKTPVLAVDLPSGWNADSHEENTPEALRAESVVTFTAPKPAHVFSHLTTEVFGPVVVAEIGSPDSAIQSDLQLHWAGASKTLTEAKRPINSNKGKFGHVLVIGGSQGMSGAPSMASLACLRAGAGLVTAAVPQHLVASVGAITPELMVRALAEGAEGSAGLSNLDHLDTLLKGIKVLAIGPALSTLGEASEFARQLVARTTLPIVIDADALNAFDEGKATLVNGNQDGTQRTIVLTPHPGEMARLLGISIPQVEADRIAIARTFATSHHVTLVLKGWRTLIAHPDGRIAINTSGNPALAKGGSGDILTGIVAAMLAQHPDQVAEAVEAAVYLHGLAADFAAHTMDEKSVLATDVIRHLSDAFAYRSQDSEGLTWLCGLRQNPGPA